MKTEMRLLGRFILDLAAIVAVFVVPISQVRAADVLLSGKMSVYSHLLGPVWTCSVKTPAEPGHSTLLSCEATALRLTDRPSRRPFFAS